MGMLERMAKVNQEFEQGDRNVAEFTLGTVGAFGSGVGDAVATVGDYMVPDALGIGENINKGIQYLADTPAGQYAFGQAENFKDAYPKPARAIGEAFDSLDLIGLSSLRRGLFQDDASLRGMHEGSGNVIVPNFYNPREVEYSPRVEEALNKAFPDEKSTTSKEVYTADNKRQNAVRKAMGFGAWGLQGIKRVAENLVNPYQRATYTEFGISPAYTDAYTKFKLADDAYNKNKTSENKRARDRALDVAHSQMQQLANIRAQANAKSKGPDASDPFMIAVTDPNSKAFFKPKEVGDNWYSQTGAKGANINEIPEADAKTAQQHFEKVWLGGDTSDVKVVVKKPTGVGGNHFDDVVARNSRFKEALSVFANKTEQKKRGGVAFNSVEDLEKALVERSKRLRKVTGSKEKQKSFSVIKSDDTGVWITGSRAGTAKVEGGINMLMKIEPNGNITGYMSDLHDFLDKVPVVKNVLEYTLPTKVLAVSPPMQSNVYTAMQKSTTERLYGKEGLEQRLPYPSAAGEQAAAIDRINETGIPKPSNKEVARQSVQAAQNAYTGGMLFSTPDEEQ